ncbi:MAG TPA: VanZ family protein [Verrucomicrobiae bacterium]
MNSQSVRPANASLLAEVLRYWLPVVAWMALVFSASSDAHSYQHSSRLFEPLLRWLFPAMPPATVAEIHHLFRKACHLTEYAIMAWLLWRAMRKPVKNDPRPWSWTEAGVALAVVFVYAASDEWHQMYVPTRTAHFSDVMIDTCGGAVALSFLWLKSLIPLKRIRI